MFRSRSLVLVAAALSLPLVAGPSLAASPDPGKDSDGAFRQAVSNRSADRVDDNPRNYSKAVDGGDESHLPGTKRNMDVVGKRNIYRPGEGRVADVAAYGNYAYLTVRDEVECRDAGVAVFDISNPERPRQVNWIKSTQGSFPGEGAQVVNLDTKAFKGQVLVFNNEICGETGLGGVSLVDVTDPRNPKVLAANAGDDNVGDIEVPTLNETHSAYAWQDGRRAFVVLVDNYEGADVDILNITNPRKPRLVSETDLNEFGVLQDDVLGQSSFLHDMTVKRMPGGRYEMLLSYWDGGWVRLDVDNPRNPKFIDDSDFPRRDPITGLVPSEGNAHQAEYSPGNRWIIGTSEDFSPYRLDPFSITTGPNAGDYPAGEFGFTVPIASEQYGGSFSGPTVYGGLGCPSNAEYGEQPPVPPASELDAAEGQQKVVVLQRGLCFFSEKIEQAQLAGYDAVIIANSHSGSADGAQPDAILCGSQGHEFTPTIAAVCVGHRAFHLMFGQDPAYTDEADAPAIGTRGEEINAAVKFDGWGYVHLLDRETMKQVDTYAVEEATQEKYASGFGDLSVHEVAVDPKRQGVAYLAYYGAGVRVIRYDGGNLREVGRFIAPAGSNIWGVEVHKMPKSAKKLAGQTVVLASDRDRGLYILRYTGN